MKYTPFVLLTLCLLHIATVDAIGGRGGGGGGRGGGGARAGGGGARAASVRSSYPTGSMSRSDIRSTGTFSPSISRGQVQQAVQSARPASAQGNPQRLQQLRSSMPQTRQTNLQTARQVNGQFRQQHPNAAGWFGRGFYDQHHFNPGYYNNYWNGWAAANWSTASSWLGIGGDPDVYYYDDSGNPITMSQQDASTYSPPVQQNIYVNQQPGQTATTLPTAQPQGDWLPIGVFAIGTSADSAPYSNMVVELAMRKDGFISGTYYNAGTDQTYPVEGMVNKETQEAVWKLSNDAGSPVMRTGVFNLTQNVVTTQVRFPNEPDKTRVLVRLQQ